jgi:SAM-dependent methyltransferase
MRVVDLDRDMSDVIPTGTNRESEFLFQRMTERTLALTLGAEPSARMAAFARLESEKRSGPLPAWVRGWSDRLPFARESFDAVICKGAIDHFDRPTRAIAEMARVTRPAGRVVLAIANFESLACRLARATDTVREQWLRRPPPRGRRHYDVPQDHFTRYDTELMREQASAVLELEVVEGISLAWGLPAWARAVALLPGPVAQACLEALDRLARALPSLSDVVVLAGRPRAATTSA